MTDDNVQHGIDDDPNNDGKKGATLGGVGGAIVGAAAGSMMGPVGTVVGAAVGGIAGAVASGVAVDAVDRRDNDDNITGVGSGVHIHGDDESVVPGGRAYGTQTGDLYDDESVLPVNRTIGGLPGDEDTDEDLDVDDISRTAPDIVIIDRIEEPVGERAR